jgi:hypothetical protein
VNINAQTDGRVKVVVATTVLLSFISFWRAAAIVLSDLGSTAFYVGGIVEEAIGRSAPWFVLGVMLFSYAVRALTFESAAMFVRAGVYRVVKEAMGGMMAKLAVSALLFDYVLTGPISGVPSARGPHRDRRGYRDHALLLAAEHPWAPRVEQRCAEHPEDHDGHGSDPDPVVLADPAAAGRHHASAAHAREPALQ